jgi:hypothetical protein
MDAGRTAFVAADMQAAGGKLNLVPLQVATSQRSPCR